MKQLFDEKELVGKMISQIIINKSIYGGTWIKFSDDSFVVFNIRDHSKHYIKGFAISIEDTAISKDSYELLELGLITKQEYDEAVIADEKRFKQHIIENYEKEKIEYEEDEKKLYEQLKKKFKK